MICCSHGYIQFSELQYDLASIDLAAAGHSRLGIKFALRLDPSGKIQHIRVQPPTLLNVRAISFVREPLRHATHLADCPR